MLKSLEKVLDGVPRQLVREARSVMKDSSHHMLGRMLNELQVGEGSIDSTIPAAMESELEVLRDRITPMVRELYPALSPNQVKILRAEFDRWDKRSDWTLINASDMCTV
jgi:hypothetical protein